MREKRSPDLQLILLTAVAIGLAGEATRRALWRAQPEREPSVEAPTGRGRGARRPRHIPGSGWKDIAWRTVKEVQADDLPTVARSIAFSSMLALFPGLGAFVAVYGIFADVETAREHMAGLTGLVPASAMALLGEQMVRLASTSQANLSLAFVFGLGLSVWSANAGMKALFKGLNVVYEEKEKRGFLKLNLVSLAFTLGTVLFLVLAMAALVALPVAFNFLHVDPGLIGLSHLRWPALLAIAMLFLSVLYRHGPSREKPKWRWVTPGGAAAAVLWMAGSALFSWYLTRFADYDATYGSLGAVFGFMTWLWLSSLVVLIGAELNAEIEHQTAADSTTGAERPLGARGASMADTIGEPMPSVRPPWRRGSRTAPSA